MRRLRWSPRRWQAGSPIDQRVNERPINYRVLLLSNRLRPLNLPNAQDKHKTLVLWCLCKAKAIVGFDDGAAVVVVIVVFVVVFVVVVIVVVVVVVVTSYQIYHFLSSKTKCVHSLSFFHQTKSPDFQY